KRLNTLDDEDQDEAEDEELNILYNQHYSTPPTTATTGTTTTSSPNPQYQPSKWQRLLKWLVTTPAEPTKDSIYPGARNFIYWNSNNVIFLLGGRLRVNKRKPISLFVLTMIILPFVFFCVFDLKFTWRELNPAPPIIFVYCWLVCLTSFIKASTSDPGIVPKNLHKVYTGSFEEIPDEYYNIYALKTSKDRELTIRYCQTCYTWRTPRTFHCSKCDSCISLHDHHCIWLNNCVGERNFRYFYNFVMFGVISSAFSCSFGYFHIFKYKALNGVSMADSLRNSPMSLTNVILSHLVMAYPLALWGYHTYFLLTGQTTREFLRNTDGKLNPFDSGSYWKNFLLRLMKPRGYSLVSSRELYQQGDERFERHTS
ncbi:hypothetical protein WICPIJ_007430, partial [Wickerhamomyces pijperi]